MRKSKRLKEKSIQNYQDASKNEMATNDELKSLLIDQKSMIEKQRAESKALGLEIKSEIEGLKKDLDIKYKFLNDRIEGLVSQVTTINNKSEHAISISKESMTLVREQEHAMDNIEMQNDELKKQVKLLKNDLSAQTDRGMRKTLIINGIPEVEGTFESWSVTAKALAEFLGETSKKGCDYYEQYIERAHRCPKKPGKTGPRPIFVCFTDWRVSEDIKFILRTVPNVFAVQMYSAETSSRVETALELRRTLRAGEGKGWKMFVAYPARLMIKKETDEKYSIFKTF